MPSYSLYTSLMLLLLSMLVAAKIRTVTPAALPPAAGGVVSAVPAADDVLARVPLSELVTPREQVLDQVAATVLFFSANNTVQTSLALCDRVGRTALDTLAARAAELGQALARRGVKELPDISISDCAVAEESLLVRRQSTSPTGRHG